MAIQAQAYQDNLLGFPVCGNPQGQGGGGFFMENGNGNGNGVNACGSGNFNGQQQFLQKQQQQFLMQQQQRQFLMQQMQQQQQRNRQSVLESRRMNGVGDKRFAPVMYHPQSQTLPALIDQHDQEIDQLLFVQNEKLKLALQEQRKQQSAALVKQVESRTQMLIAQKDQQIAEASQKTVKLQNLLSQLEMERVAWRQMAEENEAMVVSLNNTLDEVKRDRGCSTSAESCCFGIGNVGAFRLMDQLGRVGENVVAHEPATAGAEAGKATAATALASCRACGFLQANVLLLPCRHLCVCGPCAAVLEFCPVCNSVKKTIIEALLL